MFKKSLVAVTLFFSIAATSTANAQSMADKEITVQQAAGDVYMPVSYTHLTLPTIYSV